MATLLPPPRVQDIPNKTRAVVQAPNTDPRGYTVCKMVRVDQECPECGIKWLGYVRRDGLCGTNCSAIRAEIAAEAPAPAPEVDPDFPILESLKVDWCESDRATADINGKEYGRAVWDLNRDLARLRSQSNYMTKVQVTVTLVGGEVYTMRPNQYGQKASAGAGTSHTIQEHVVNYRSRLLALADGGTQVYGQTPEQLSEMAEAYQRVILALGA